MFLVDTSVWIEVFRRPSRFELGSVADLDEVVTCLPVIQEVLQGFQQEHAFRIAREAMFALPVLESPLTRDVFEEAAQLYRTMYPLMCYECVMTQNEYEHYRRRLDDQLASGIELLKAAHAQQVHALELVWRMQSAEEPIRAAAFAPAPAPADAAAPAPRPARRRAWELVNAVEAALPSLPEVFDRRAVIQALGYEPDRGSLYRALQELARKGVIVQVTFGEGRAPTTYRRAGTGHSPVSP